jgi:hypothetical protein
MAENVFLVFNATISVISWWSLLLVGKTTDLPQVTGKLYHKILYRVHLAMSVLDKEKYYGYVAVRKYKGKILMS